MLNRMLLVLVTLLTVSYAAEEKLPMPTPQKLPRWRGFNLLEKFNKGNAGPYKEQDFQLISELGFNFVRLPMDYRVWIVDGDWNRFNESVLKEIDQAVAWGQQYQIHVCLNFHRAPGYTVAQPPEPRSLWDEPEVQQVCARHWGTFARRYRGISNRYLSFNLMNEPASIEGPKYAAVVRQLAKAIRDEDPDRLIISDGLGWGRTPCQEIFELNIAQAGRGYQPFQLTHYQASWVNSANWSEPVWPVPQGWGGYLFGPAKAELQKPMVLNVTSAKPAVLSFTVGEVSALSHLVVRKQGDSAPLLDTPFKPGPGAGPWKESTLQPQWEVYRARYDQEFAVDLPIGSYRLTIANTEGDWMTISRAEVRCADRQYAISINPNWATPHYDIDFDPSKPAPLHYAKTSGREQLWTDDVLTWVRLQQEQHVGAMIGEWGAYNKTPHDVTLRWMEDCLANYQRGNLGWALWNFRGSFGILDSGRKDVRYEPFHGHQLDRQMLELLQRY